MAESLQALAAHAEKCFGNALTDITEAIAELTLTIERGDLVDVCRRLRDDSNFKFEQLIDLCGVDYLDYGRVGPGKAWGGTRFAVVYHLLSITRNQRVRLRVAVEGEPPVVDSVTQVWSSADWYEREAFDLFGIVFDGHPDLRRILSDYGFIGHPFRKDFPLIGHVEMRYDPGKRRVVYQPVSIEARTIVPRVIREEGYGGRDT